MLMVYGIKNCDSVKKTKRWLEQAAIPYTFHDFRADGISATLVSYWCAQVDENTLLNRRSTTWKQLSDAEKSMVDNGQLVDLLVSHPTLIKRPVIATQGHVMVGFEPNALTTLLSETHRS